MKARYDRTALLGATVVCVSFGAIVVDRAHSEQPPAQSSQVRAELAGMRNRLAEIMKDLYVPGLAVVVVRGDDVVYLETLGQRDVVKKLPVTPDTMFYIASCTKTYVAMAIAALAEDNKLDLDDPVKKHLPKFEVADPELTRSLTIRDLLAHSKGLSSSQIVWLDAFTGEISEARYYHWLREAEAKGTHKYTNVHYTLAGRVVEAVTGKSWKDYLQQRIFKPAGMARTTCYASLMYGDEDAAIPTVRDYTDFEPALLQKTDHTMHAAGGMGTTISDLGRWLRVNLNGGRIDGTQLLSKKGIEQMQTLQDAGFRNWPGPFQRTTEGHGLAWETGTYKQKRTLRHGGGYVGTAASIVLIPDQHLGIGVLANADGFAAEFVTMEIADRLLGLESKDLLPQLKGFIEQRFERIRGEKASFAANPAMGSGLSRPQQEYVGTYSNDDLGTIRIDFREGKMVGTQGQLTLRFGSTGTDQFVVAYEAGGMAEPDSARFEIDPRGKVAAVIVTVADWNQSIRFARQ